jgi:hypothetical protein
MQVALLQQRSAASPSQLLVAAPRPSSGGITDSFGRPFEPLWGDDDDDDDDDDGDDDDDDDGLGATSAVSGHGKEARGEGAVVVEEESAWVVGCHASPRSSSGATLGYSSIDSDTLSTWRGVRGSGRGGAGGDDSSAAVMLEDADDDGANAMAIDELSLDDPKSRSHTSAKSVDLDAMGP